jgi:pimeloyl-ACP methyl ester carboxylesterase
VKARTKRLALTAATTAAGIAFTVAVERYLVQRARSRPDPERDELLAERPGDERRVRSFDGTELAVHVAGPDSGPTLVFSHGFTLDMTAWHYQWKRFSRQHRVVLYDHRGHGRSDQAAGGDYSLEALAHDLKAVLDAEAPNGPVVLLGHSMGGMAIVSFAAAYPEEFGSRVQAVVLANTAVADLIKEILGGLGARVGALLSPAVMRLVLRNPKAAHRLRGRALARRSGLAFLVAEATNFGPKAPPSLIDYVVGLAATARPEVWTDLAVGLMQMDLAHALEHIVVPSLILVGDVDRLTPPSTALAMKHRLPDARMVVLKGAGHCAMLERHSQFNRVVDRFLTDALVSRDAARA